MALPNTNISVAMVKAELGAATNDVGRLCIHPNVNKWSKWKPVRHNSITPITEAQLQSTNYGLMAQEAPSIVTHAFGTTPAPSMYDPLQWVYLKPTGGLSSPYRLPDFINYNKLAIPAIADVNDITISDADIDNFEVDGIDVKWYPSFKFGDQSYETVGSMTANREIHLYMLEIIKGSQIKDGNWRMALAIWNPINKQYYIASSELPIRTIANSNDVNTIFVSLLKYSTSVRNLLKTASVGTVFTAIPILAYKLNRNTSTNEFAFIGGRAFNFPEGNTIKINRVAYPIDLSVQSYEWFYTGTASSIYLQATGTTMGSIGVVPAGSSLSYRLEFKVSKRLILTPSRVKIQFKDGSSWMDLPVTTINGDTYADLSTGSTAILEGSSQAFNTLIRGKTNPTAPGSYLASTIRIIDSGAIIGSVDIRYMKAE